MKNRGIRQSLYAVCMFAAALTVISCTNSKFRISGKITQAKDSLLFLENLALDGPQLIDSLRLDEGGDFVFEGDAPTAPEFYRLRIAGQTINLSVDSTENIRVTAAFPTMATQYAVEGSDNCLKIKELSLKQMELQQRARLIADNPNLSIKAAEDSVYAILNVYKDDVERNYIYKEPMKAYAYFALFQYIAVGNSYLMVFNPRQNPKDIKAFQAVATSWDTFYPASLRGKNLYNITIESMKDARIAQKNEQGLLIDADKVSMADLIDLALTDNKGQTRRLTDLKGKVVLLDFHLFGGEGSTQRIMQLRELYNKYHSQGLEIYQVSLDGSEHFWKTQTAALPWICVHDDGSRTQAYLAAVPAIPCYFIIGRDNMIKRGPHQIKNIETEIQNLL